MIVMLALLDWDHGPFLHVPWRRVITDNSTREIP